MMNTRTLLYVMLIFATATQLGCESKEIRILTGGISHESNTFIPLYTTEADFSPRRGEAALEDVPWADFLKEAGVEIIPTLHVPAHAFGVVERKTFDMFKDEILAGARAAGKMDGVFLDMHRALHAEGYEDAQVDFVRAIRKIVGPDAIIAGSFDLHGNISPEFASELNILTGYRTAPHVDGEETRLRAVTLLLSAIHDGKYPQVAHVNVPILIPGEKGITALEPLKTLYAEISKIAAKESLVGASIFVGMPWTDVDRAGMSVQVVAEDTSSAELAHQEAVRLANMLWERRAGLKFDVPDAVLAGIVDQEAVAVCAEAGVGAKVELTLGGKLDNVFSKPLEISGTVQFVAAEPTGASQRRPVVIQVDNVQLVILSERRSFTEPTHFEEVNIDPLEHKIVVVKLGYLFQGLRDIAPRTIMALTPGFAYQVVENITYTKIRRPIYPIDIDMQWSAGN